MYKTILLALAAAGLAACVTATNTLPLEDIATLRLAAVDVSFAPNVTIWWGDGERAFAASKGQPATESENLAKTPEGQAYLRNTIAAKVRTAVEQKLSPGLTGPRPVRANVVVKEVRIASAIQRIIIGGQHTMTADVTLVDAKTGAILLPYAGQTSLTGAGQGLGGVLVDAALLGDAIDRVIDGYAAQYANWMLRRGAPFDVGSAERG